MKTSSKKELKFRFNFVTLSTHPISGEPKSDKWLDKETEQQIEKLAKAALVHKGYSPKYSRIAIGFKAKTSTAGRHSLRIYGKADVTVYYEAKAFEAPVLDQTFIEKIKPGIIATWNQIASDVERTIGRDNNAAIEIVLDQDNLKTFAGEEGLEADEAITEMTEHHDYNAVMKFIAKHIKLA